MHILYPFAKRFIAGEDMVTALQSIQQLNEAGFLSTIDHLGEHTLNLEQAEAAKQEYIDFLEKVRDSSFPLDFSIKLSQMGLDISKTLCRNHIESILKVAGQHTVRFDMEGSDTTQSAVDLCVDLHRTYQSLGIALQAYLFRTEKDAQMMIDQGVSVRLCKGAYQEPEDIAFQDMDAIRENFLKLAQPLLKEGFQPSIATHDEYLIAEILKFIAREQIDPKSFYFELLFGVRRDIHKELGKQGFQVRIYVPYGKSWLPYTLRRLAERKENILFVVKSLFKETFGLSRLKAG